MSQLEVNTEAEGRLAEAREALAGGLMDAWGVEDGRNWGEPLHPRTMGVIMAFEEAIRASERASLQGQIDQLRKAVEASVWYAQMVIIPPSPDWRPPIEYTQAQMRAYDLGMKALNPPQPVLDGEEAS